jgi:hypothetical protein
MEPSSRIRQLEGTICSYCEEAIPGVCLASNVTRPCDIYVEVFEDGRPTKSPPATRGLCSACVEAKAASGEWELVRRQR